MTVLKRFDDWTPPPGFIPVASQVSGIEVYAPAPPEEHADKEHTFHCPQCNGLTAYDPGAQQLVCPYCGYQHEVGSRRVGLAAERFEFTLEALDQSEKGWGVERKQVHCESCNAVFNAASGDLSSTCPFCSSNRVVGRAVMHETIRPGYLVPFTLDESKCKNAVKTWLGRGWMYPAELRSMNILGQFTGIYLPFWVFDARLAARWRAQVGHEKQRRHYRDGKWETETVIDWRWENGQVGVPVSNLLIYGTDKISTVLLERLYPYDLTALREYDPAFLAGLQAQAYDIRLKPAWELSKQRMRDRAKQACYDDISSSHVRDLSMTADFNDERWRYVLLPVYLLTYKFENEVYHAMVNGQTGAVSGQKPVAWSKVWIAIALCLAPSALLGLLGLILLLIGGIGVFVLPIAFVLFVFGLVGSILIFIKAREADDI